MFKNASKYPEDYIDCPDYKYALHFEESPTSPTGYKVTKNNKAYQDYLYRDGWFVLLTNCEKNPMKTLEIYRTRDVMENAFDIINNFITIDRTSVNSCEVYENKAFIGFLVMILISMIQKVMKENKIFNDKIMVQFLSEMSSIKKVIFSDMSYVIDPIPESIKNYLDLFKCPYPNDVSIPKTKKI
jgi:transposase